VATDAPEYVDCLPVIIEAGVDLVRCHHFMLHWPLCEKLKNKADLKDEIVDLYVKFIGCAQRAEPGKTEMAFTFQGIHLLAKAIVNNGAEIIAIEEDQNVLLRSNAER
jgi:hypothetical protein